jgi:hypothetical protein
MIELKEAAEIAKQFLELFNLLKRWKFRKDEYIIPPHQGNFEKITYLLEDLKTYSSDLEGIPLLKDISKKLAEFEEKFEIAKIDDVFVILPKNIAKEIAYQQLKKLKEGKIKELAQPISILPSHDKSFIDFEKTPRYTIKEIAEIINKLPLEWKSLINLSFTIKNLYEEGIKKKLKEKIKEAEEIKMKIRQLSEKSLKFCNCFLEGYIEGIFIKFKDKGIDSINQQIEDLLKRPIFFIHAYMDGFDIEKTIDEITIALGNKEEYVGIHSLGVARIFAKVVIENVTTPEGYKFETKEKDKEFTAIWYLNNGRRFYELLEIKEEYEKQR